MQCIFLAAWIADKEEQNLIATLGANSCTTCIAETHDLGVFNPLQIRTGASILKKIQDIRSEFPNADTWKFITECQKVQLSGVEEPFWLDLPFTDICKVICNDTLHGLHKSFKDHTAQWNINRIGEIEIDS